MNSTKQSELGASHTKHTRSLSIGSRPQTGRPRYHTQAASYHYNPFPSSNNHPPVSYILTSS